MNEKPLKTAVLGLNDAGQLFLEAISKLDYFRIEAVADKDSKLAENIADKYNCKCFDDYRQLVIQNDLDCLLVAADIHSCGEYVRMAMKKKINILKLAPPARDFAETADLIETAGSENVKFAIVQPERFSSCFIALREFLDQKKIEKIFLISAICNFSSQEHPKWQSSPQLAGGGVLLHNCYEIIDQIIWNFGMPQEVYSLNTNRAADRQQRICSTEDTAVVTMKFDDGLIGNMLASRLTDIGPEKVSMKIYGKNKILTAKNDTFIVSDELGNIDQQYEYKQSIEEKLLPVLDNFALSILEPDENKLYVDCNQILRNMAVIEAAYLSARTGFPEAPEKVLGMAGAVRADTAQQ